MTATFDHLVLTRFSAILPGQTEPLPEDWLRYRLQFFYDTAYPSLAAQQGAARFQWLVFFDDRCSAAFRAEVQELSAGVFEPVWTHEPFRLSACAKAVSKRARSAHLITTRVDSDDAVSTDFIASVQEQFEHQDLVFVNFARGFQIDRSGWVYVRTQPSSPFLSLIEHRVEGSVPLTVFASKHHLARRLAPIREVRSAPMWVQVVHGGNVSNVVEGRRVSPDLIDERFVLTLPFRRDVGTPELVREQFTHSARLAHEWVRHPGRLTATAEATLMRRRGTHVVRQGDGRSLTDVARDLGRRLGYRTDGP